MQRASTDDGLYVDGNPSAGTLGTRVTAACLNAIQEELAGAIEEYGLTLDADDNGQLLKVLQRFFGAWMTESAAVTYASASTFTVAGDRTATYTATRAVKLTQTSSTQGHVTTSSYSSGTGLTTVTVDCTVDSGLSVVKFGQEPGNEPTHPALPRGYLSGLTLANNSSDANNDIDIAAGEARNSTNAANLILASAITKRLDAAWAAGTGNGGLDTGSKAISTWYHVYLIGNGSVTDACFSTSASAPTLPSGYTYYRRIGSVLTDGSGYICAFKQLGNHFDWVTPVIDYNTSLSATNVEVSTTTPLGISVIGRFSFGGAGNSQVGEYIQLHPMDVDFVSGTFGQYGSGATDHANYAGGYAEVRTNTARKIRASEYSWEAGALNTFVIATLGWIDFL